MKHTRMSAVVVVLAVVLAACGGDDDVEPIEQSADDGTAAPPDEEEPPDEPDDGDEPDDPFAVPDDIDEAYAQSVLDELFVLRSDALRAAVKAHGEVGLPEEAAEATAASHAGPWLSRTLEQLQDLLSAENLDEVFREPEDMGAERFELDRILVANEQCLLVTGLVDSSEVNLSPPNTDLYSVVAVSRTPETSELNPTPWRLYDDTNVLFDGEPAEYEVIEGLTPEDVEPLLDMTCGDV